MDGRGDAQASGLPAILPADLQDRARRNRANPTPLTATVLPPAPPPAQQHTPPPPADPQVVPRQGEKPTEHVLRLANDVRVLTYAISYMRKQLTEALETSLREAQARAAIEAKLASEGAPHSTELAAARAELDRVIAQTEQLRQTVDGAHRQAEQWSERARQTELRLKTGMHAANEHIARLTEQATALEAAVNQLRQTTVDQRTELDATRAERDAANERIAELEAQLVREQSRHPRGGIAAMPVPGTAPAPTAPSPVPPAPSFGVPVTGAGVPTQVYDEHPGSLAPGITLEQWQQDALVAWSGAHHRGVVEAVTSAGNARLAYWAIGRALDNSMKVLVLTPSAERVDEWYDGLRRALPNSNVGKHTGRGNNRLAVYDVVVAAGPAVAKEHVFEPGLGVLVVADEVHEFGTEPLARALDDSYVWRLGLTTAYERDDDGLALYLNRYFGGVAFRLGFDRALDEQAIASFDLALVAAYFSSTEQAEYNACAAASIAGGGGGKAGVRAYLKAVARRDEILARTTARDSTLRILCTAIRDAGGALVVAPTPQVAEHVARLLGERGCTATPQRPEPAGESRLRRGAKSEDDRDVWLLVSPREAAAPTPSADSTVDLVIMVSPPRSRRDLVERLDRAIGGAQPGGHVRLVVVYIEASVEEERASGGDQPLATIAPLARRRQRFTARDTDALLQFVAEGRRVVTLPPDPAATRLERTDI